MEVSFIFFSQNEKSSSKTANRKTPFHAGAFFVPSPGSWNYFFREVPSIGGNSQQLEWPDRTALEMEPVPAQFADPAHRPNDFLDFSRRVAKSGGNDDFDLAD